jgi:RHS repeat-associated protein
MSATAPNQTVFSIGYDFHFGAGNNGNVFSLINYRDQNRTQTFTYDALNRLTSAQNAGTDCTKATVNGKTEYWGNSYSYDAWGNLLTKTPTKCSAENLNEAAWGSNQLHTISGPDNAYDAAGNMTRDATTGLNYTYDAENRITGAGGYTYTYDADGNRVEKSKGSTGTLYWYMTPGIVAESDLTGALKSEYVFFDGERVARKDFPGNAISYYFSDHLKTASVITDSAGNIKEDEDYYPWGGELQFVNSDSNHFKFGGHERDSETGLDYMLARYYSNPLARFLTPDWGSKPITVPYANFSNPQSLNLYTCTENNPTTLADPDGHEDLHPGDWGETYNSKPTTFDNQMSAALLNGFSLVTGPAGKAFMAADAVHDWRSGDRRSAALGTLAVLPMGRIFGSVWKLGNFVRGAMIESMLGANLPRAFPVIDKFLNGVATSIKSLDLTAKTYQNAKALASKINGYVDKLADFNGAKLGQAEVELLKSRQRSFSWLFPPVALLMPNER